MAPPFRKSGGIFVEMFDIFERQYRCKAWGSGSGPGSLPEGLGPYYAFLQRILNQKRPASAIDLGCGFFSPYACLDWEGINYVGIDVVEQCIAANQKYSNNKRTFIRADWSRMGNLPDADLAICKDVLQHWSHAEVRVGLKRLAKFPLVLITNSVTLGRGRVNCEIQTGGFRPLNLLLEPYMLRSNVTATYKVVTNSIHDVKLMLLCEPNGDRFFADATKCLAAR